MPSFRTVYIQGPGGGPYEEMFTRVGIRRVTSIESCDFVCFTGGEDVGPDLYGEQALITTHFNGIRDEFDCQAYSRAKWDGNGIKPKPCVGICRGAQFLNVMNGGSLWQDVNKHTGSHMVWDPHVMREFFVTSTHHQQMIPRHTGILVAYATRSTHKMAWGKEWNRTEGEIGGPDYIAGIKVSEDITQPVPYCLDSEVVWYPDTQDLCFQPHPEFFGVSACREYFFDVFNRYIRG